MLLMAASAGARGIGELADALADMPDYAATVTYAITLPQAENDVVYNIRLQQPSSPDSYLIDWSVDSPSGPVNGFTAWFDGHFYNFHNRRLQEHHRDWDKPAPEGTKPLQNSARFASLLPSRLAMQLREVASGPYTYTLATRNGLTTVEAIRTSAGEPDAEFCWTFRADTSEPVEFYADYNPGAITGQQVKAVYSPTDHPLIHRGDTLTETALHVLYPAAFSRYRESLFAIENMRGEQLPAFSLPEVTGGRLTRRAGDLFAAPTAVVLMDPEATLSATLVNAVRRAVDRLPVDADVIWACTRKNPEAATAVIGPSRRGETVVTAAGTLATDCGASTLPVVMICNGDGIVHDLITGLNNTLETDVIRMLSSVIPH